MSGNRSNRNNNGNNGENGGSLNPFAILGGAALAGAAIWGISKLFQAETPQTSRQPSGCSTDSATTEKGTVDDVEYVLIKDTSDCQKYIRLLRQNGGNKVVGLDIEWENNNGIGNKVAVLQLCSPNNYCLLIQLPYLQAIPAELREFLLDKSILKVGVGIDLDIKRLNHAENRHIEVKGAVDLRYLVDKNTSLADLAKEYLGIDVNKNTGRHPDWLNLNERLIKYAVRDASSAVNIFEEFFRRKGFFITSDWEEIYYEECIKYMDRIYVG